ncbi:MAG: hypothetical protein ACLRPW_03875 [Intestinibacter sp.]
MKKLISIGEALIDFMSTESVKIKQVDGSKALGGAPSNVCAFTKLGGSQK